MTVCPFILRVLCILILRTGELICLRIFIAALYVSSLYTVCHSPGKFWTLEQVVNWTYSSFGTSMVRN